MAEVTHLLDTHTVIWAYLDSEFLGSKARRIICLAPVRSLGISDFSLFELALLIHKGRITVELPLNEMLQRVAQDYVVLPIGAGEAQAAIQMPLPQADPFDRAIVATAYCLKIPLLTKDKQIKESGLIPIIW